MTAPKKAALLPLAALLLLAPNAARGAAGEWVDQSAVAACG